jgi:uncharacterized protein involved in exopolysaccharide biosynthesis
MGEELYIDGVYVTREDLNFPSEVKSNGSLEISDKDMATSKALNRIMMAIQMQQAGVADVEDTYNAYVDWLEKDGVKDPDDFSTNPQEILQSQLAQLQQQVQQLSQQAESLSKERDDTEKDVAKLKKKGKSELNKFQGEYEATAEQQVK